MEMVKKFYGLSSIAAVVALMFLAVPAMSQEASQQQGQEQPGATESQTQVSDGELQQTAVAYAKISAINEEFQQSVQKTEDQNERQQLQNEANQMMLQAVENAGLDAEKYTRIMAQIRTNEQTAQRFDELFQKKQ